MNVTDPANGNALIGPANYSGGNPDVGLETARTSVYGFVYQPTDKFSVTVDKYDINIDDAIGQLTAQQEVNACYNSAGHNSSSLCQYVIRDAANQIVRVDSLFINLSNQRVRGDDLELNYSGIQVGSGTLGWRFLGTRLDENSILTPGTPRDEHAGDVGSIPPAGGLPKNKFTTYLTYAHGPFSIFLQERYIGGGVNDHTKVESTTRLPGLVTVDDNSVDSVLYTDLTFNSPGGKVGTHTGRLLDGEQPHQRGAAGPIPDHRSRRRARTQHVSLRHDRTEIHRRIAFGFLIGKRSLALSARLALEPLPRPSRQAERPDRTPASKPARRSAALGARRASRRRGTPPVGVGLRRRYNSSGASTVNRRPKMLTLVHAPRSRSTGFLWLLEEAGALRDPSLDSARRRNGRDRSDEPAPAR